MNSKAAYILFFAVVAVLQIFLLNNLSVSVYVAPVIYAVCIIMLPLETPQIVMLVIGALLGALMDVTMGTNGLNVAVALPVAVLRRPILYALADLSNLAKIEGVPSAERLGDFRFHRYVVTMMMMHTLLFFGLEWLSVHNFGFFLARWLCSTAVSIAIAYPLIYIFTPKLSRKL